MRAFAATIIAATFLVAPLFTPVQPELFSAGGTLTNAWADVDADGDADLFVGFNGEPNRLYRNDGGRFAEIAGSAGIADARPTRAAAWGDADGDGDADLLVGFTPGAGSVLRLYRNDGARFADITAAAGLVIDSAAVRQPAWIDYDADGDLDLFIAFRDRANALFRNDGDRFTDVAERLGVDDARRSVGAVWLDYDADGDVDLLVGNMDGDANGLFRNDGARFTDVAADAGVQWGGRAAGDPANGTVRPCAADVDNDGRLDLFFANYGPNGLFLNRGDGTFADVSVAMGIAIDARYDTCAFADYDNDGRIDLFVNGTVTGGRSYRDHLFRNTGDGFRDTTPPELLELETDHGAQWHDFDDDGAIDLAVTGARPQGTHALLRNALDPAAARAALRITILDEDGRATLSAAEVRLYEAGTGRLLGVRMVDTGSGYDSQSVVPVHFGLGTVERVDVEVTVPRSGTRVTGRLRAVAAGRAITVRVAPDGSLRPDTVANTPLARPQTWRQTQADDYTRYELQEPGSAAFRILYDVSATAPGALYYFNTIRQGAEETVHGVTDLYSGRSLEWRVVDGTQARAMGMENANPDARYIAVSLDRPVPEGGQARVRIDKTYVDPASYRSQGDRLVFERTLGIDRNAIVLPAGFELVSCNVPAQVAQEEDGRIRVSFMNAGPAASPLRIEARVVAGGSAPPPHRAAGGETPMTTRSVPAAARRSWTFGERAFENRDITYFLLQPETSSFRLFHDYTETRPGVDRYVNVVRAGSTASSPEAVILDTGQALRVEKLTGRAITERGIDIGGPVDDATEAVVIWFDPVPQGGSVRLRITETYTDPSRYLLDGEELLWDRAFGRPRNTVVLPEGWYLTANAIPAAISLLDDGRIRLRYINDRPDEIGVFIRARRR